MEAKTWENVPRLGCLGNRNAKDALTLDILQGLYKSLLYKPLVLNTTDIICTRLASFINLKLFILRIVYITVGCC